MPPCLHDNECHLFVASTATHPALERLHGLLNRQEIARCERFRSAALRRRYTLAHGVLRLALGEYLDLDPAAVRFTRDHKGRPELRPAAGLDFSLSYASNFVACAIARADRIGVDIESLERDVDWRRLSRRVLSRREHERLAALPRSEAQAAFMEIWVLKEAYSKALGEGVGLPFHDITLMHCAGAIDCDLGRDRDAWQFALFGAGSQLRLALAGKPAALTLRWREAPAASTAPLQWLELARHGIPSDRQEL